MQPGEIIRAHGWDGEVPERGQNVVRQDEAVALLRPGLQCLHGVPLVAGDELGHGLGCQRTAPLERRILPGPDPRPRAS